MIQPIRTQKAQMKMGETIMVLLAFFMLLGIGLVIYANFQKTSILRQASETFEREAVRIALKTAFYPEFACSEGGVVNENCFDIHKVRAFGKLSDLSEEGGGNEAFFLFHETELRDSKIYIEQIFPPPNVELGEWEEDDDEQLTRVTIYDNSPLLQMRVLVGKASPRLSQSRFGMIPSERQKRTHLACWLLKCTERGLANDLDK